MEKLATSEDHLAVSLNGSDRLIGDHLQRYMLIKLRIILKYKFIIKIRILLLFRGKRKLSD